MRIQRVMKGRQNAAAYGAFVLVVLSISGVLAWRGSKDARTARQDEEANRIASEAWLAAFRDGSNAYKRGDRRPPAQNVGAWEDGWANAETLAEVEGRQTKETARLAKYWAPMFDQAEKRAGETYYKTRHFEYYSQQMAGTYDYVQSTNSPDYDGFVNVRDGTSVLTQEAWRKIREYDAEIEREKFKYIREIAGRYGVYTAERWIDIRHQFGQRGE